MASETPGSSDHPDSTPPDSEKTRRHIDRTGKDWTLEEVADGFTNRLRFAEPGKPFKARPGTNDLPVDTAEIVTIGDMINLLVHKGVLARTDEEDVYTKQIEGLCADPDGPKSVRDIAKIVIEEKLAALDLTQEEDLREFLKIRLAASTRKFQDENIAVVFLAAVQQLAESMTQTAIPLKSKGILKFVEIQFSLKIMNALTTSGIFKERKAARTEPCIESCRNIVRDIAQSIADEIYNHPSNHKS